MSDSDRVRFTSRSDTSDKLDKFAGIIAGLASKQSRMRPRRFQHQ
jgi:hypothetical protein